LPERVRDYARALASVGLNGCVINNVNAKKEFLTSDFLQRVTALADLFRDHGITLFLSAPFAAPTMLGGLATASPFDASVVRWWRDKAGEILDLIPDFGGFLVKADSEGQPGPSEYGATHADGANLLADAVRAAAAARGRAAPIVMW